MLFMNPGEIFEDVVLFRNCNFCHDCLKIGLTNYYHFSGKLLHLSAI